MLCAQDWLLFSQILYKKTAMDQIQAAAEELLKRQQARRSIYAFMDYTRPTGLLDLKFKPAQHHKLIIDDLHQLIAGVFDKEAFSLPPGSAKSTYISVILPVFLMAVDPTLKILCLSAGESLAEDFARRRRSIMRTPEWQRIARTELQPDAQGLASMSTKLGGTIYSAGAGTTIQGLRADWIIMDDLVKGFEMANSMGQLDKLWNWLLSECRSRLKPHGRELVVATRWSAFDPIGRFIELDELGLESWKYCRIPMECDDPKNDPLKRKMGQQLWKEWFTPKMLSDAKRDPAIWACLYQQTPLTSTGEWCPPDKIKITNQPPNLLRYVIGVDIALSISNKSDWTVFAVIGIDTKKDLYLVDLYRVQKPVDKTAKDLAKYCEKYNPITVLLDNDNASTVWAKLAYEESKKAGVPLPIKIVPMKGRDKEARAAPLRSYLMQDRFHIVQAPWNTLLMDEFSKFPVVRHDDQIDAIGLVAAELIKISAPREEQKTVMQRETVLGLAGGRLVLNQNLDDLFADNERGHSNRFSNQRI